MSPRFLFGRRFGPHEDVSPNAAEQIRWRSIQRWPPRSPA